MQTRDLSSAGAAFYDSGAWHKGQRILMDIQVGDGIVGPFSYALRAVGKIVRRDVDRRHGMSIYAVSFESGIRMYDWMELEPRMRSEGRSSGGS